MVTAYVANTESVTSETFDEDTVLINFMTGTYFSLRGSAPFVWRLLQLPATTDRIIASVVEDPDIAREAVRTMLDTLVAENCVLTVQVAEADLGELPKHLEGPYTPPVIESFHDLQELIVVDPVHEVDQIDGWPHRPPPFGLD